MMLKFVKHGEEQLFYMLSVWVHVEHLLSLFWHVFALRQLICQETSESNLTDVFAVNIKPLQPPLWDKENICLFR